MMRAMKQWILRRRVRGKLRRIRWDLLESDPSLAAYRATSGEYQALLRLKMFADGLPTAQPMELVQAILLNPQGDIHMASKILDTIT